MDDPACGRTICQWGEYWQLAKPHEAISSSAKGGFLQVLNEVGILQVLNEANMEITWLILDAQNESAALFSQLMFMGQTIKTILICHRIKQRPKKT